MSNIFLIISSITLLFFILLGFKEFLKGKIQEEFCVICLAVSVTWIIFLILYIVGIFKNQLILALLIGESTLGIYYLADKKIPKIRLFRLPLLLTLIIVGYSLLSIPNDLIQTLILLITLWMLFSFIYLTRTNKNLKKFVEKIIECCKNW